MSMIDRSLDGVAALSGQVGTILRRCLRELGGIALISLAMMAGLALASWSVSDPSLSHATDAPVHNLLGVPGAIFADLMMQLLGLGSLALLLPMAVWGYRLLGHRPVSRHRLRLINWLVGAVFAAAFASCLPRGAHWPLPCGLGGVVGDAVLRLPMKLLGITAMETHRMAAAAVLGTVALLAFAAAAGLVWRKAFDEEADEIEEEPEEPADEDEADGGDGIMISLGRLTHALLSFRARLMRLLRRKSASEGHGAAIARQRVEPRLDQARDHDAESEQEDDATEDAAPRAARKARPPRPRRSTDGYALPSLNLLAAPRASERTTLSADIIRENAAALEGVLADFGVRGEIINARPGPVVTLYELEPAPGIKSSRVIGLADDIARSMSAVSARVAVVPGRNAIGIELPNPTR